MTSITYERAHFLRDEYKADKITVVVLTEYALRTRVGKTAGVMTKGLSYATGYRMDRIRKGRK